MDEDIEAYNKTGQDKRVVEFLKVSMSVLNLRISSAR